MWRERAKRDNVVRYKVLLGWGMHESSGELSAEQMAGLAERILTGDRAAEDNLLRHFTPRIYALLCARTRDREASRDLLHDTLLALIGALRNGQLREPEKLTAFILGIARNTAHSFIRSGLRRREEPLEVEPVLPASDSTEENERQRHLEQALAGLDPTDREILRLTLVEGFKPGVIAKALGMSSDVVRQRKTRATRKMAEYVQNISRGASQTLSGPRHGNGRSSIGE